MSDLISRSKAVQRLIQETVDSKNNLIHINTVKRLLQDVDTSYDIDKVVEQLEEKIVITWKHDYDGGRKDAFNEAIGIVKHGGVSDDVCEWRLCDEEANVYDTSCRNPHILIEGTPRENNYKYCPYCGKKIKEMECDGYDN